MNTKKRFCIIVLLFLAACRKDEYHTVDWYIEHDQERMARFAECETHPVQYLKKESDCINARDGNGIVLAYGKEVALRAVRGQ
jgi:hypothetical protein